MKRRECDQRRVQDARAASCIVLAPHPAPYQVRGRLFGHFLPAARGEGVSVRIAYAGRRKEGTAPAILDGDALAAKLDEARASHNGTHVVAVAVHLDPEGRCCGADHPRSVARCSQRPRQRRRVIDKKLRAGSHEQVNIRCLARAITAGTRSVTGWRQAPRRAGAQRRRAMSPRWRRPMPPCRRRVPPPGPTRRTVRLRTPHSRRNSGERMPERPRQVPTWTSHSHSAQPSCSSAISSASA